MNVQLPGSAQPVYPPQPGSSAQPGYPPQSGFAPQPGYPSQPGYPPQSGHAPPHVPQTVQQVQQSSTVINVGVPATQTVVLTPSPHPPNYLFLSVFTCLCCVWPLGLAAIVYSCMVDSSYGAGDYAASVRNSNIAKWLNVASILCGIIINIIIVVSVSA
ncbi:Tumor suppressor candidate 5-like [Stylophora pistillata]|uniref:Tumor suppressor candidate 5-like n=2 Tax=Stylophora pistillata TaxID=50429 RepID=A0A2B4SL94_STYPI|nr:Tumor suppressor candidate 5-like [Stylophora pistillata]